MFVHTGLCTLAQTEVPAVVLHLGQITFFPDLSFASSGAILLTRSFQACREKNTPASVWITGKGVSFPVLCLDAISTRKHFACKARTYKCAFQRGACDSCQGQLEND